MYIKRLTIISLLLCATAFAASQKLYELPDITTLRDAARFYVFDSMSGNRNMTGLALKNAITVAGGGLPEAPVDGTTYGRKDAAWIAVTGGSGVSQSAFNAYSTATQGKLDLKLNAVTFTSYTSIDRVTTTDNRLSDSRTPTSHNNTYHSETYITSSSLPVGGTPALTLGTANTAGTSPNFLRRDDTILAFDATAPSTQAFGDAAATGSATVASRRDHKHAMPATTKDTTAITGILKGNGSVISAAASGTDYQAQTVTVYKVSGSDFTSSLNSAVDVTGLTWSIAANQEQSFDCMLNTTNTATSLFRFGVNGPASPTAVAVTYSYRSTAYGTEVVNAAGAFTATTTTAAVTSSVLTTPLPFHIRGIIKNGSNAGTVAIRATASTNGQTGTVRTGSMCRVW